MHEVPATLVTLDNVGALVEALSARPVVAVDTEFHAERRYWPELLFVQLHVPEVGIFLVDPLVRDVMRALAAPLAQTAAWIVHGGRQDLRLLRQALGGVPEQVFDTQVAAALVEPAGRSGLDALLRRFLGRPLCKAIRMADWSRRPLPEAQLAYAAEDVRWLPELWEVLASEARVLSRSEALVAACAEARSAALDADPTDDAFRYVTRDLDLDPLEAGTLRALMVWRDRVAQREDRPPPYVVGDATLRELARSRPSSPEDLAQHRRLNERTVARHGAGLLAAISTPTPVADLPVRAPRASPASRRLAWMEGLAALLGAERHFAPDLVMPRERLESLACATSPSASDVELALGGWRCDLIGADLHDALEGRVALALGSDDVSLQRTGRFHDKGDVS